MWTQAALVAEHDVADCLCVTHSCLVLGSKVLLTKRKTMRCAVCAVLANPAALLLLPVHSRDVYLYPLLV